MDRQKVAKGLKKIVWAIVFCFIAPIIVMQAFKNQEHPLYIVVLVIGIIFIILVLVLGFQGISNLVNGLLGENKKK